MAASGDAVSGPAAGSPATGEVTAPVVTIAAPVEEIARLLRSLQRAMLRHPLAVHEAVNALAGEGRSFAETEEGKSWRARLEASGVVREARTLWEGLMLPLSQLGPAGGPADGPSAAFPGALVDDLFAAASAGWPEMALARAFTDVELRLESGSEPPKTAAPAASSGPSERSGR